MTSREFALGWASVLGLVAAAVLFVCRPPDRVEIDLPDADIVFVGSSVMAHAIPQYAGPETAIISGKTHFRVGLAGARQQELIDLLEDAIAQQPELVVIEINPFLLEFNEAHALHQPHPDILGEATRLLALARSNARGRLKPLVGTDNRRAVAVGIVDAPPGPQDYSQAQRIYPIRLLPLAPDPALTEQLAAAEQRGVAVAFMLPPRSAAGTEMVGPETSRALAANAQTFAQTTQSELIDFGSGWDDELYVDFGHFNNVGRDRFIERFNRWYAERP